MFQEAEEMKKAIDEIFIPRGKECGQKIAKVLRNRGHDQVISLYRSAVVLEIKKSEKGIPYISIKSYDDPHFMGAKEISDETVKDDGYGYVIRGTRSGIKIHDAFEEKLTGEGEMMTRVIHERLKETRADIAFSELLEQVEDVEDVNKLESLKEAIEGKIQYLEGQRND